MSRRHFLKLSALGAAGMLATGCKIRFQSPEGEATASGEVFNWKLVTTWPPHFPIMGEGLDLFAGWVKEMSGGRLNIQVYGGGELVPPLETFDAVSLGTAEMGHSAAYYWSGKVPAAQFFCAVPFGMNAQQMNAWLTGGGGLDLWQNLYAKHNLVPFPAGNTGVQMGGWFNKRIDSVSDLQGLKIRMPGLGGKVMSSLGATAVLVPGSELYTNLERGVIDAAEWIGPYHDYLMGFPKIARYYYYPGWHEPGPTLELIINRLAWQQLPPDLQRVVTISAGYLNQWMLDQFEAKNALYLKRIREEGTVEILPFPDAVIQQLRSASETVLKNLADSDQDAKEIVESYMNFRASIRDWAGLSEISYYRQISGQ